MVFKKKKPDEDKTDEPKKDEPTPGEDPKADAVERAKQDEAAVAAANAPDDGPVEVVTVPVAKPAYPANMPRLRVTADWKGSINGSVTALAKGKIINPRHYGGPAGIKKLRDAGVVLKEIKG